MILVGRFDVFCCEGFLQVSKGSWGSEVSCVLPTFARKRVRVRARQRPTPPCGESFGEAFSGASFGGSFGVVFGRGGGRGGWTLAASPS